MPTQPKLLLIQARLDDDPMRLHELYAFCEQTGLPPEAFVPFNVVTQTPQASTFEGIDAVMVGGSGDFSFVKNELAFRDLMFGMIQDVIDKRIPMFASCFGFQAIVETLGGKLGRMEGDGEVGTFTVELTEQAEQDPVFDHMPPSFYAQLGHLDEAVELPENCINLCRSELTRHQALRIKNAPVVATQFHPELSKQANLERYIHYMSHYKKPGISLDEAIQRAEEEYFESPESSSLIRKFLQVELDFVPED